MRDRLYRSRTDRVIGGVAGGVARALDVDPSLVRVAWVVLALLTGGLAAVVYLVMLVVVPEEPGEFDWDATRRPIGAEPAATLGADDTPVEAAWPSSEAPPPGSTQPPAARPGDRGTFGAAGQYPAGRSRGGPGSGALVFGLILILIGGYFLVREYVPQLDLDLAWPVVLIVLGGLLVLGAFRPGQPPRR